MSNDLPEMMNNDERPSMYIHTECVGCDLPLIHVIGTSAGGVVMQCGKCKFVIKLEPRPVTLQEEE